MKPIKGRGKQQYICRFFFSPDESKTLVPQHVPLADYIAFKNVSALVILEPDNS